MTNLPTAKRIGYPSRDPDLDVLPGFIDPPEGYGEVAFYWWLGDPLTKERIQWQLGKLRDKGLSGLQVNYAHSDIGGRTYGLTYPSEPSLFSEDWWNLFTWFLKEARKNGMSVSLSDYTLGIAGQGWYIDEILREHPEICGATLQCKVEDLPEGREYSKDWQEGVISIVAYRLENGGIIPGSGIDLRASISGGLLLWNPPEGDWRLVTVSKKVDPLSIDPMNPLAGAKVIEKFFQRFEDRNPGESGKGLNFFFSDELQFGVAGNIWNDRFAEEFLSRKGYDIIPELPALFMDMGSRTPKVRLDYWDVVVALEEDSYFRPIYEWHDKRGMIYGCDHGGRGLNVVEFGDYFRTQRWMPGPGNDSPQLSANITKNKVASSITHLYERPRTWLEGFHSSGWGTTAAQVADATFRNFVMGHNLLSLHGLYYSTHGGWWEWAPPCNHFRMPYWEHIGEFLRCSERLSYILSQGVHCCDVAVMYPVSPVQAEMDGRRSVEVAFATGNQLFNVGIDFDFMDFESLARTQVQNKQLHVSGEAYRVLVLPAMRAVRHSTLRKVLEFYRSGGIVIAVVCLPEASDRIGRDDPEIDEVLKEVFGFTAKEADAVNEIRENASNSGGLGIVAQRPEQVVEIVSKALSRDFVCLSELSEGHRALVMHRRIGPRDAYMVYGAPKNSECFFRAKGKVELWDPWTGGTRQLHVLSRTGDGTEVRMPLEECEVQLIVFSPGAPALAIEKTDLDEVLSVSKEDGQIVVRGTANNAGKKTGVVCWDNETISVVGGGPKPSVVLLDGEWEFELKPTLDNQWGDYRLPALEGMIKAEVRRFRYAQENSPDPGWYGPELDDSDWEEFTYSYGPNFWKLGPLPESADTAILEARLACLREVNPRVSIRINGNQYFWQPYSFSMQWGIEGDPGHQGYHGLKGKVTDDFIALGKQRLTSTSSVYESEEAGSVYYLWTSVFAEVNGAARIFSGDKRPSKVWLNGEIIKHDRSAIQIRSGSNPLLLRYDGPGRTHFIMEWTDAPKGRDWDQAGSLSMTWHKNIDLPKFDIHPEISKPAGWYRFTSPPGLRSMVITCYGETQVWADGRKMEVQLLSTDLDGERVYAAKVIHPTSRPVKVVIRVEQERGFYGGAALSEPILLDCIPGKMELGDWSQIDGLASYSGGAWYRKTFELSEEQLEGQIVLDLGIVSATAEVHVNSKLAGIKVAPPWKIDISEYVMRGENRVEVLVYNTLANHYMTIPTRYRGSPVSGLIGPVKMEIKYVIELIYKEGVSWEGENVGMLS